MTNKTFTIAGTSDVDGVKTFRFANHSAAARVTVLAHHGHTNIQLDALPRPMTKIEAISFLVQKGVNAVVPTRAVDKMRKSAMQLEAEAIAAKRIQSTTKARAARDARTARAA